MKQSIFEIRSNEALTDSVYKMILVGDTSDITNCGQFVNIQLDGMFLRRPISVCDYDEETLTLVYKVVGQGTEAMSLMTAGTKLDILTGLSTSTEFDRLTGALDTAISENGELIANIDVSNLSGDAEDIVYKAAAWLKLDYPIFTSAPDYMETSCTFICKLDPIRADVFSKK